MVITSVFLALCGAHQCFCAPSTEDPIQTFRQTLQMVASDSSDPCTSGVYVEGPKARAESTLFGLAADMVIAELNVTPSGTNSPAERARDTLKKLEHTSARINAAWPIESRFHFQVLDVSPVIVMKVSFRVRARFFVLSVLEDQKWNPKRLWTRVGLDEESLDPRYNGCRFVIDLYPLHRGPSGNARFLARFSYIPCSGITFSFFYDAYEWNPEHSGHLDQFIKQEGAFGLEEGYVGLSDESSDRVTTRTGAFFSSSSPGTEGSLLSLPYCWRSPIDGGDHPAMCAVDTYDLSGDSIKFRSRAYNDPDLLPIAKAMEYAQKRNSPAILGYCTNDDIALRMARDLPNAVYGADLQVNRGTEGKEHVDIELFPHTYHFDVEKRGDRWLIVAFNE